MTKSTSAHNFCSKKKRRRGGGGGGGGEERGEVGNL